MPLDPHRVEGPFSANIPPVTLKYPLVQKLIETPVNMFLFNVPVRNDFSHAERELQ